MEYMIEETYDMNYKIKSTREQLEEIYTNKRIELVEHILYMIGIDCIKPYRSYFSGFDYSIAYNKAFDKVELAVRRNDRFTNKDLDCFDTLRDVMKEQQCEFNLEQNDFVNDIDLFAIFHEIGHFLTTDLTNHETYLEYSKQVDEIIKNYPDKKDQNRMYRLLPVERKADLKACEFLKNKNLMENINDKIKEICLDLK